MKMSYNTLYGYELFRVNSGRSLFENIELPSFDDMENIDKSLLTDTIIDKSEEFPCTYDNIDYLQWKIEMWFKKYKYTFNKWWYAIHFDYEPLYNFDRYEESHDESTSVSSSSGTSEATSESFVNTYPSNEYNPNGKGTSDGETTTTGTGSVEADHTGHLYGNIGVTTSQQMLQSEIDLFKNFNFYDVVADMFVQEFCCMVY